MTLKEFLDSQEAMFILDGLTTNSETGKCTTCSQLVFKTANDLGISYATLYRKAAIHNINLKSIIDERPKSTTEQTREFILSRSEENAWKADKTQSSIRENNSQKEEGLEGDPEKDSGL